MAKSKRSGRRSGKPDTRAEILRAARELFAAEGFESVSLRRVGTEAGVDPALIHHYFGSKDELFLAAIELPIDPAPTVAEVLRSGSLEDAGERLMRAFTVIWEGPHSDKLVAVMRTGLSKPAMSFILKQLFEHRILTTVIDVLGEQIDHPRIRANFIASQIFGIVATRYILKLEPLASLDVDALTEIYGPTIDRYLTMPVAHLDPSGS